MRFLLLTFLLFPSYIFAQVNLNLGLVAHYTFDGNDLDIGGNNNNPVFNNATLTTDRSGNSNSAYHFNGIDNYIRVPNSPSLNMGNQLSLAVWIRPTGFYYGTCHGNSVIIKGLDISQNNRYAIRYEDGQYLDFTQCGVPIPDTIHQNYWGSNAIQFGGYSPYVEKNNWVSVIYTYDGTNAKLYINCDLVLNKNSPGFTYTNTYDLLMGKMDDPTFPYWLNADLDDVRVYNRPLNEDEVTAIVGNCLINSCPVANDFAIDRNSCDPYNVTFTTNATGYNSIEWDFGDGNTSSGNTTVSNLYGLPGNYTVTMITNYPTCADTVEKNIFIDIQQDNQLISTNDTTICLGTTKQILAKPGIDYCWTPTTYLNDPTAQNPITSTPETITYYLNSSNTGTNLITNGDFSSGNTGFTSSYLYSPLSGFNPGVYNVGSNITAWHSGMSPCSDHTTGTGNMMMVNGADVPNVEVWSETVPVQPNTNYAFSTWLQHITTVNPASLQFSINGTNIGPIFNANSTSCVWEKFYAVWNSGNNTSAHISIVNQNQVFTGNDFALDDISFAAVTIKTDSVVITVDTAHITANADVAVCAEMSVQLNATGGITYSWTPATGLSNPNIANPIATPALNTQYIVTGININGCIAKDTVNITITPRPDIDFNYQRDICNPFSVQFNGLGSSNANPYWAFGDGNTSNGNLNPTNIYSIAGNYEIKYTVDGGACTDTITKLITLDLITDNIVLTPDTTICYGSTKKIRTSKALNFCWTPTTYLDDPTNSEPTTSTPESITYYYTAEVTGSSLITNGDFSGGNTGFTSAYQYANPNVTEGQYFVGSSPQAWNNALSNCSDHTSGNGKMMLLNGSPTPNLEVWKQTINITPNTNYAFSTWIQALYPPNPAQLQFSINGKDVGTLITASLPTCTWTQFYTTWNSGTSTTATISIVNKNTIVLGNDFALDDISFAPVFMKRDSVIITVDTADITTSADAAVCEGIPVQINTTGAVSYSWTPTAGLSDPAIANPVATPAVTTEYHVTGINANGCEAKDTVLVTIMPGPSVSITNDTSICTNTSLQLNAAGGITYNWSPAATLDNPDIANPLASPTVNTVYYVTVTNAANCSKQDSVQVDIIPPAVFGVNADKTSCLNDPVQLNAFGGDTYTWQPQLSLDDPAISNPVALPADTITYTVTITESVCNESATLSTTVNVVPLPLISASRSNDIDCSVNQSQLNAAGAVSYIWSPDGTLNNPAIPNPIATPTSTTLYTVTGIGASGCMNTDTVTVKVSATNTGLYQMPTAFSPNNDGLNDCYGLKYWGFIEELDFSIYNRWGERIFHTSNPAACWDGYYKGVKQNPGVYVFMVSAKTSCTPTVFRKGTFALIR